MKLMARGLLILVGLLLIWQLMVHLFALPPYILPAPSQVFAIFYHRADLLYQEAIPTIIETLLGLGLGIILGFFAALTMAYYKPLGFWFLPILIISQAIPTFAIAPLLVIWFGFGLVSKIFCTVLMIFFPMTSAFYDGLKNTNPHWLDIATTMNAKKSRTFFYICIPAALPRFMSGLRIAAVFAPIGAIIGEWVGASHGLGFLMLNANARMQIDLMFAALAVIVMLSLGLYFLVDKIGGLGSNFLKY